MLQRLRETHRRPGSWRWLPWRLTTLDGASKDWPDNCHCCTQVITALGKTWHPEHFTCTHCNQELGTRNFFEREGHPYCETDYHNLFSPRCAYCNGPILDVRTDLVHGTLEGKSINRRSYRGVYFGESRDLEGGIINKSYSVLRSLRVYPEPNFPFWNNYIHYIIHIM
jgi:hypothetical protein